MNTDYLNWRGSGHGISGITFLHVNPKGLPIMKTSVFIRVHPCPSYWVA